MWLRQWPYGPSKGQSPPSGVVMRLVERWDSAEGEVVESTDLWVHDGCVRWIELEGDWLTAFEFQSRRDYPSGDDLTSLGRHRWWLEGLTLKKKRR